MPGSPMLQSIEMALRYRGPSCAWTRIEDERAITLAGVDNGKAFAIALDGGFGPTPDQIQLVNRWRKAGARTGTAATIKDVLAVLNEVQIHAG